MVYKIGIVGLGYVGSAIANSYRNGNTKNIELYTYDIDSSKNPNCKTLNDLVNLSEIIFIAVPTPMNKDGFCDTSIVENIVEDINKFSTTKIIIIKSTIIPGTTERLQEKYSTQHIFFSPEFLTEANHLNDYLKQSFLILGKPEKISTKICNYVLEHQTSVLKFVRKTMVVSATSAEMFKYLTNAFLATKVSFANEMFQLSKIIGVDWNDLQEMIMIDDRLGKTHWKVPGPDGHLGYGGNCFPKDVCALIKHAETMNIPTPVLNATWKRNKEIDRFNENT
jgi:UDPglucose 6-dehydrogenase